MSRMLQTLFSLFLAPFATPVDAATGTSPLTGQHPQPAVTANGYTYQLFIPRVGGHASRRLAAAEPERFAAVTPVAGRGDPAVACALRDKPVWAFHGDRDDVVIPEGSFAMIRAVRACGGKPRLTIYPGLGHNAWDPAYDDPAPYLWFLSQRLGETSK